VNACKKFDLCTFPSHPKSRFWACGPALYGLITTCISADANGSTTENSFRGFFATVLLTKPAVRRDCYTGIGAIKRRYLMIDIRRKDNDLARCEAEIPDSHGVSGLKIGIRGVPVGVGAGPWIEEPQQPAQGLIRHRFTGANAVDRGPGR
jgi:hypothetical protein